MTGTALIPMSTLQQCAMAAIAATEARKIIGKTLSEHPYAKAFFREFTSSTSVTVMSIRRVDPGWNPERGGATKDDFIIALDRLLSSRGEAWTLPLTKAVVTSLFPSSFAREIQRTEHRQEISETRQYRKEISAKREQDFCREKVLSEALAVLKFCRPGEHKAWLDIWRERLEDVDINGFHLQQIIIRWWSTFWIARVRTEWRWCEGMYEFMNELDYVIKTMNSMEYASCCAAVPVYISSQPVESCNASDRLPTV